MLAHKLADLVGSRATRRDAVGGKMRIWFLSIYVGLLVPMALGDCDCTIVPFKPNPPCFEKCTAMILAQADYRQLTGVFGLAPTLSKKIVNLPERKTATSLDPYKQVLSLTEISTVETAFKNLTKKDLERFFRDRERSVRDRGRP